MKEQKILNRKFLPTRLPLTFTCFMYLFLDKFHAAGWMKGAGWTFTGLLWGAAIVAIWHEKPVTPEELFKSESGQAIAEFAVLLPIFVLVGMMLVDMQWLTRDAAAIEYIANESARCEAIKSGACPVVKDYARNLAANLRLSTDSHLQISAPSCSETKCDVSIDYQFKPLGAWFPAITIHRTGTAAVAP
jgi:hypothetical protein